VTIEKFKCSLCEDTGYYGDQGPGIEGNDEYGHCECRNKIDPKWAIDTLKAMTGIDDVDYFMKTMKSVCEIAENNAHSCECDNEGWCAYCTYTKALELFPQKDEAKSEL